MLRTKLPRISIKTICAHHKEDFGVHAEWNFFATSHGKSACDGIGGTVKRLVAKASLQRPYNDQILSAEAMYQFCLKNIPGITFFNVPPADINEAASKLQSRFETSQTIKGTQQYHRFAPINKSTLQAYKLSNQKEDPEVVMVSSDMPQAPVLDIKEQSFVCCIYDGQPWIGLVEEVSEEYGDYHVNFMHPHGPAKQFNWPLKKDTCWVAGDHILCLIDYPSLTSSSSRKYTITDADASKISRVFPRWESMSDD